MKTTHLILTAFAASTLTLSADDDTPVPPEIQKLAESFVTAFKSSDDTALTACFHSPAALAKLKGEMVTQEASASPTPLDAAKETEKELKRQTKNMEATLKCAAELRGLIAKHFDNFSLIKLEKVELDPDEDAPAGAPAYDGVDLYLSSADGGALRLDLNDVIKIADAWKFKDRIEGKLTIYLPEED